MIIESLGREMRLIDRKLGHSFGNVVRIDATVTFGGLDKNLRSMEVVLGERNKGMNGMNHP